MISAPTVQDEGRMTPLPDESEVIRELRAQREAEGSLFWLSSGELGVFDPEAAQKIHTLNFGDLTLPDKLADQLLVRKGEPVSWKNVRAVWLSQMRRLSGAEALSRLAARMGELLDERLDRPLDLLWAAQEVCSQSLAPTVVTGLSATDMAQVVRDQQLKIGRILTIGTEQETLWQALRGMWINVRVGSVIRRELRGRATGRRPRQLDLADPIVELLPALGIDRAVDAVTGALTAIAGPPGEMAACVLYELTRRPEWTERLTRELEALALEDLYRDPTRLAPLTHRFVKETLRMWGPQMFIARTARTELRLEQECVKTGQRYLVSPYFIHHDPGHWKDPYTFDPDRWLEGAPHGACSAASYVAFGWAPTMCIGVNLGTAQLILMCHFMCTRYKMELANPEMVRMMVAKVAQPRNFLGTITRR
jgi:cytochrome P450